MPRPALEVADIFRDHGAAWRSANAGHVSLDQLKVMSAIERCRTVALGGHVARCEDCADIVIAYNSCRNRHCPKCQATAAKEWLAEREAELLPVGYFHLVFTLAGPIADIAYQNKAAIYGLLFTAAAEATMTIAADLVQRHVQTLVADNAQWQTLIADDLVWELVYAPSIGHPARLSGRAEVMRHVTCTPPLASSTAIGKKRPRTREPAGTGVMKRTRLSP